MATTTPNYGWPVPTSTDLVKNGATAIEALGDAIDASIADLKGGTTGQVLSKNSNTDMDFVWVTDAAGDITGVTAGTGISGGGTSGTVTVTNSMATAIDAKADLIAGTGADTFSRLAVGANDTVLTAASGETTGLKWAVPAANAAWTSYTPTITAQSGTPTTVSATGAYSQVGKNVSYTITITITTAGTAAGFIKATLPITPNGAFSNSSQEVVATGIAGASYVPNGDASTYITRYDNTTYWANSRTVIASGNYTVA